MFKYVRFAGMTPILLLIIAQGVCPSSESQALQRPYNISFNVYFSFFRTIHLEQTFTNSHPVPKSHSGTQISFPKSRPPSRGPRVHYRAQISIAGPRLPLVHRPPCQGPDLQPRIQSSFQDPDLHLGLHSPQTDSGFSSTMYLITSGQPCPVTLSPIS